MGICRKWSYFKVRICGIKEDIEKLRWKKWTL